ncbi:hypothetical protein AcW1_010212 [Taiwanofungus camphoratus]|nr:hypothetical protein AcW1_010212 [Antrodia cinnamomea]KAI0954388.1 hypothetical protein AcV7_007637 [Antrodia cinnamomea]
MSPSRSTVNKAEPCKDPLWYSYLRLTRLHHFPIGPDMVFWPCTWGLTMSAYNLGTQPKTLAFQSLSYFIGCTIGHAAGCVWDDICDYDLDRRIGRTTDRPLASGHISLTGAYIFLLVQVVACLWYLSFAGEAAFKLGLFGMFVLNAGYPFMKRWSPLPPAWLGVAVCWGLPVSWVSNNNSMDWKLVPTLLIGGAGWMLYSDTIYASQDRRDDEKAGVKSAPVLFGDNVRLILSGIATFFISSLIYAGIHNGQGPAYFIISVACPALHMFWQMCTLDFDNGPACWNMFRANCYLGWFMWAGLLCDYILKTAQHPQLA